jgi:hypothetical protein
LKRSAGFTVDTLVDRRTDHHPILAIAMVSGPWTLRALRQRVRKVLGPKSAKRAKKLIDEIFALYPQPYPPTWKVLARVLGEATALDDLPDETIGRIASMTAVLNSNLFRPIEALSHLSSPKLTTPTELARWLEIPIEHIEWVVDHRRSLDREKTPPCSTTTTTGARSAPATGV